MGWEIFSFQMQLRLIFGLMSVSQNITWSHISTEIKWGTVKLLAKGPSIRLIKTEEQLF